MRIDYCLIPDPRTAMPGFTGIQTAVPVSGAVPAVRLTLRA